MIPYFITCLLVIISDPIKSFILSGTSSVYDLTKIIFEGITDTVFASGSKTASYILGMSPGHYIGAVWFLPTLFFARIFTQIILKYIKPWNRRLLAGFGMLVFAAIMSSLSLYLPFSMLSGICGTFYVLFGMFIREKHIFEKLRLRHYIAAFAAILLIYGYGVFSGISDILKVTIASSIFPDPIISVIATLCACIIVMRISMLAEKSGFFSWFGRNSLTVLCAHLFTLNILQDFILEYICPHFPFEMVRGTTVYTVILSAFHVLICSIVVIVSKPLLGWWEDRIRISRKAPATAARGGYCSGRLLSERGLSIDRTLQVSVAILAVLMISMPLDLYGTFRTMLNTFVFAALALIQGYRLGRDFSEQKRRYLGKRSLISVSLEKGSAGHFKREFFVSKLKEGVTWLLIPYAVFGAFYILSRGFGMRAEIKTLVSSMATSGKYLSYDSTVGVAWIIPALFFARVIYTAILCFCEKKYTLPVAALALSMLGAGLGSREIFLPCSLDIALFLVIFFFAGHMFAEYDLADWYINRPWFYFIAAAVEAYLLYSGTINYANREYGTWAYCVLGGIVGTLILFNIAHFICSRITVPIEKFDLMVSRCAFFIILSSAALQPFLNEMVSNLAGLSQKGMANALICCAIELIIGIAAGEIYYAAAGQVRRKLAL